MEDEREEKQQEEFNKQQAILEIGVKTCKLHSLSCYNFITDVLDLLYDVGYKLKQRDVFGISLSIKQTESYFTSKCNRMDVPAALESYALQYAVADFLERKLSTGNLEIDSLDLSTAILTSIEMGDIKESFDKASTDRTALEKALQHLKEAAEKEGVLKCHTRVKFC